MLSDFSFYKTQNVEQTCPQDVTANLLGLVSTDRETPVAGENVYLLGTFRRQEIRVNA